MNEQGDCDKSSPKEQSREPRFVQNSYRLMNRWVLHIKIFEFIFRITENLKP